MTLTEAASATKFTMKYFALPILLIMFIWVMIRILTSSPDLPGRYITPDYMCGQLQELELDSLGMSSDTEFSIETTSGAVPDLPEVVNVFKYNHPGQSLLALQEAQRTAELLEFEPENYTRISTTEYKWYDPETKRTLVIETGNQNLSLTTDYTDPSVDTLAYNLPSEDRAKDIAKNYLQKMNLLYKDYNNGKQKTYLIQITADGEFREAPSLAEADLIRVDFFRDKDLITIDPDLASSEELGSTLQEELEGEGTSTITTEEYDTIEVKKYTTDIVNDSPIFGNISVYVGGKEGDTGHSNEIFGIEYKDWILGNLSCGTYRLISPQEAVKKVQEGDGGLAYLLEKNADRIIPHESKSVEKMTILEVSLNYIDLEEKQGYLQPVYVIRGEAHFGKDSIGNDVYGEFYYFVPAIDYDSIPENAGIILTPEEEIEET